MGCPLSSGRPAKTLACNKRAIANPQGPPGMARSDLIQWSCQEAAQLRGLAAQASPPEPWAVTARARQFLADHADGTAFEQTALSAFSYYNSNAIPILAVAVQLEEWAAYRESGVGNEKPFEVRFRIEASTDLMEQVHLLLGEPGIHVAAPVVLAGAALEEFLRSNPVNGWLASQGSPHTRLHCRSRTFSLGVR
jgi:hypothetical protein